MSATDWVVNSPEGNVFFAAIWEISLHGKTLCQNDQLAIAKIPNTAKIIMDTIFCENEDVFAHRVCIRIEIFGTNQS